MREGRPRKRETRGGLVGGDRMRGREENRVGYAKLIVLRSWFLKQCENCDLKSGENMCFGY